MKIKLITSLTLAITGVLFFCGCAEKRTKEEIFWVWFADHQEDYYMDTININLYNVLSEQLNKINEDLTFEFGPIRKDGIKELEISAAGIKASFPAVLKLVEKAPKLEKWKISAFRQRKSDNYESVEYGNLKLSYDDIYFRAEKDGKKTGIELFVRDFKNDADYNNAIFLLLDNLLGEYDVETSIGWMETKELDEAGKDTLHKFIELRQLIDDKKK